MHCESNFARIMLVFFATVLVSMSGFAAEIAPVEPRCEYLRNPLGITVLEPRLSWKLQADDQDPNEVGQTAFQILVASAREMLVDGKGDLWDSGKIQSHDSLHHVYRGKPLSMNMVCWWTVRVWDQQNNASEWSSPARFTIGPVKVSDWTAAWIGSEKETSERYLGFSKRFKLETGVKQAFAYVASIGYHELRLNGKPVNDRVLTPHVVNLRKRTRYITYDLTEQLRPGENQIELLAGSGWARLGEYRCDRHPLVRCQLDIETRSAGRQSVVTDASWQTVMTDEASLGPWKFQCFGGEKIAPQQRLSKQDVANRRLQTKVFDVPLQMSAEQVEPNRVLETLTPIGIEKRADGWRIDFGRTFTGWLDVSLEAAAGTVVELSVSEREDQDVTYGQTSQFVIPADGRGRFRNRFNYACGRWLLVKGPVAKPTDARAMLIHTDYPRLTEFRCSNDLLNRIHDTSIWTLRCLSLGGYVVDCSHRERFGYGGDAHATVPTGLAHFGLGAFYTKWLEDWRDVQGPDGDLPYTAPTYFGGGGPAWSGIVIQLPWQMYVNYGDRRVLEENWPMMIRWIHFVETKVQDGLLQHYGDPQWGFLGDWVPPGRGQSMGERVDLQSTLLFNNCYWHMSLQTAAAIADVLGHAQEATRLRRQATQLRKVVHERFWDESRGVYASGEQLYLALPLLVGIPPEPLRPRIQKKLEETILVDDKGHINAGIHGHAFLLEYLTRAGRADLAFAMISKESYPSWGHMLSEGATTIWEQWDGKNSRCHSSFLGVGAWFIRALAGIVPDPKKPGYEHFFVRPQVCGDVTSCAASYESIRGRIESRWSVQDGQVELTVVIPVGTTATVLLPGQRKVDGQQVGPGTHHFQVPFGR